MSDRQSRRQFLKRVAKGAAAGAGVVGGLWLLGERRREDLALPLIARPSDYALSIADRVTVARHADHALAVRRAVDALGGMGRFVRRGDVVIVKPNIGWERPPELGANTAPEVVAAVVALCLEAGARLVRVFDRSCNDAAGSYRLSGIAAAAENAGACVSILGARDYVRADFVDPRVTVLTRWPMNRVALHADALINVPCAKHHGSFTLTLAMKNLMGLMGGNRGQVHTDFDRKLADLLTGVQPSLNILDATRLMVRDGPTTASRANVRRGVDTIIAGANAVAVDAYAAQHLPWLETSRQANAEIGYLRVAGELRLGTSDPQKLHVVQA
jgi:uncharacterized protein (DUF362 family)